MKQSKEILYVATGYCWGKYWGGGQGGYEAKKYSSPSKVELDIMIEHDINDGSIDSGMGFESIVGALMKIVKITTIKEGEDEYVNKKLEDVKNYGNLSDDVVITLEDYV